ncbi:MAG: S46 family peptidase [Saprospiraceae bacterium]
MKRFSIIFGLLFLSIFVRAGEGMWLPLLLKQLNEAEMKGMGMKMSAEDIYSVNKGSLKDAIVHFGGFCTGEIISGQGLLLTNHHCGYGQIQSHTTLENNYLQNGFWAKSQKDELPNPGLFATFIVRIEDVTEAALKGVTETMNARDRQSQIDKNLDAIRKSAVKETYEDAMIRPFFKGNQYFMFITETYRDVRLVGTPPDAIGKFGADTDNWVWPRHTGDFSLFRVYAGKDNKPAEYSPDNVPLKPRHFLPISMDGISEGDFTMVFGFPGRTDEYLPGAAVAMQADVLNPIRIGIRDISLEIIGEAMRNDPAARIQYASKQARISNSWKKWIGESQGIHATGALAKKRQYEQTFQQRVMANAAWKDAYGNILPELEALYKQIEPYAKSREYISEITAGSNIELFQIVNTMQRFLTIYKNNGNALTPKQTEQVNKFIEGFEKDYRKEVDQQIFARLMEVYFNKVKPEHLAQFAIDQITYAGKSYEGLAKTIYEKSILANPALLKSGFTGDFAAGVEGDYAFQFCRSIVEHYEKTVLATYNELNAKIEELQRKYMKAQMDVFADKRFYPDANSTLRVTYGKVASYEPKDAVKYTPVTYLSGVMEKYKPGDYEFDVPERLRELHAAKDYGRYAAENGQLPVCFIGSNHTTGGNSGSPAVDAWGNLVGLNFDRVWEGTMSDLNYDASICRNIMVDIRYVLFIIDKYAGAGHLVSEMKLVNPKKRKK